MKIAIISTIRGPAWGGSEELWAALAEEAMREGHEVMLSVSSGSRTAPRVVALQAAGARLHFRPWIRLGRFAASLHRLISPARAVVAWRPDCYCISQGSAFDFLNHELDAVFRDAATRSVPYLLLSHGNANSAIETAANRCRARDVFAAAKPAAFVAKAMVTLAERQIAASIENAVIVANPVNMASTDALSWPSSEGKVKFAHVSRVEVQTKGIDILLQSLAEPQWRNRDWHLSIFGDGPARGYLVELTKYYGLAEHVRFAGHVSDIRGVWNEHHLMVLPSRTEGLPLALIEAMLCGRPCVATDVGAIAELIRDSETGFLAAGITSHCLSSALERAWEQRGRWREIGDAGRQVALQRVDLTPGRTVLQLLTDAADV